MKKLSQIETNDLIELLMEALSDEWLSMLRYQIHASRMRGIYGETISEHLQEHADDEKDHADRLTRHFYAHDIPIDINIPAFNPGNEPVEMIQLDLEGEIQAINRYTKIAELCEDIPELTDTRMLIEDLLVEEVDHQDDDASFIKAKINSRETPMSVESKISIASTFIKAADLSDDLGLEEFANRYTQFAKEIK